ncbi:EAL domain-containing protein, partial [uncultured Alteromonas sp.]|uniref:EAL domain-containing protein n=1 Tax=uncultured Alteromonas sp. TaxID=179113 RepID=UPI00345DC2B5
YNIDTSDIELEITEGAFISDFDHCILLLTALRDAGFALSIDDFGTGYSSLSYLTRLPVDTIKIDMSFVRELARSDQARQIYKGMIDICKAMHFDVLAEGVEDDAQREALAAVGCDRIQGYLLSKPLPVDKLLDFLNK